MKYIALPECQENIVLENVNFGGAGKLKTYVWGPRCRNNKVADQILSFSISWRGCAMRVQIIHDFIKKNWPVNERRPMKWSSNRRGPLYFQNPSSRFKSGALYWIQTKSTAVNQEKLCGNTNIALKHGLQISVHNFNRHQFVLVQVLISLILLVQLQLSTVNPCCTHQCLWIITNHTIW